MLQNKIGKSSHISFKNQFGIAVTVTPHFSLRLKLGTPFVLTAEKN